MRSRFRLPVLIMPLLVCTLGQPADALVYQCKDHQGHRWFSDLGCKDSVPVPLDDPQVVDFTPVPAPAERTGRPTRPQPRANPQHAQNRAAEHRRQACAQAEQVLQRLRERRRKGYSLDAEEKLEVQQNAAKRDRQRYCR